MKKIVGIEFKEAGKIYWFDPNFLNLKVGDKVVVETARGVEMGFVIIDPKEIDDEKLEHDLKKVLRLVSEKDQHSYELNKFKAEENFGRVRQIIAEQKVNMKPLGCEYTLDGKKLLIYYTADGRVDFRELVKVLANEFKIRIELRQVGPREGAKMIGGFGYCGRELCCKNYIREFDYVTMKMAKEQGMALSPDKITGLCGKLMCCIGYECDFYVKQHEKLPNGGDIVKNKEGKEGKILDVNYISENLKVFFPDGIEVVNFKDITVVKSRSLSDNTADKAKQNDQEKPGDQNNRNKKPYNKNRPSNSAPRKFKKTVIKSNETNNSNTKDSNDSNTKEK